MELEQKTSSFNNLKDIVKKRDVFYWMESIFHSFADIVDKEG